jgi:hypothetical protein
MTETDTLVEETKVECGTCKFWLKRSDRAGEMGGGYCVRFPPFAPSQYRVRPDLGGGHDHTLVSPDSEHLNDAWPMVHQQSWCGEWKQRKALTP